MKGWMDGRLSVFAVSTYDTDYILVREVDFDRASGVLSDAGHGIVQAR